MFSRLLSKRLFIVSVLLLVATMLNYKFNFFKSHYLDSFASYFVHPVLRVQQIVLRPVHSLIGTFQTFRNLNQTVSQLYKDNELLRAQIIRLQAENDYAQDTQHVVDFAQRYEEDAGVVAQVVVRNCSDEEHFVLVDIGTRHGIEKNMVAVHKNRLIGKVTEVYPLHSKVTLITDRSCKVSAYCTKTGSRGICNGTNSLDEMVLNRVSHLDPVRVGDQVFSSGEGLIFPQGFGLGTILSADSGKLFYTIKLSPLFDIKNVDYVMIFAKGTV